MHMLKMEFRSKSFDLKWHSQEIQDPVIWTTLSYFICFHVDQIWVPSCPLCSMAYEYPGSLNWDYTNGMGWIRP